jgi:hypothetical protein
MNLFETLKQFKSIQPDPAYKETSKRAILATLPKESRSAWRTIAAIFETGIAVALTVFFVLVITGKIPGASIIAPVSPAQFSVINPESLRAEARAVDIQIQLTNISYPEASTTLASTQPMMATKALKISPLLTSKISPISTSTDTTNTESASSTPASSTQVSVDEALEALTQ